MREILGRGFAPIEYATIRGYIKKETDKAMLVHVIVDETDIDEETKPEWFPMSQVKAIKRPAVDVLKPCEIVVAQWILKKKGLL